MCQVCCTSLHANSTTAGVPAYGSSARRRSHWLGVRLGLRVACVGGRGGLRGQDEAVLIGSRGNNHAERRSWNAIKTCAWVETRDHDVSQLRSAIMMPSSSGRKSTMRRNWLVTRTSTTRRHWSARKSTAASGGTGRRCGRADEQDAEELAEVVGRRRRGRRRHRSGGCHRPVPRPARTAHARGNN